MIVGEDKVIEEPEEYFPKKYPELFPHPIEISVGKGWYKILDMACSNISAHIKHRVKKEPDLYFHASQIKEKFGGLRFYYDGGNDYTSGIVTFCESMSYITCEVCGNRGIARRSSWIKTLCDVHHQEREDARSKL